jgi:hypothetical protein
MTVKKIERLRDPLGIILGWTELLREGQVRGDKTRLALDAIARNARLQAELIDELAGPVAQEAPLLLKKARSLFQASSASPLRKVGR